MGKTSLVTQSFFWLAIHLELISYLCDTFLWLEEEVLHHVIHHSFAQSVWVVHLDLYLKGNTVKKIYYEFFKKKKLNKKQMQVASVLYREKEMPGFILDVHNISLKQCTEHFKLNMYSVSQWLILAYTRSVKTYHQGKTSQTLRVTSEKILKTEIGRLQIQRHA